MNFASFSGSTLRNKLNTGAPFDSSCFFYLSVESEKTLLGLMILSRRVELRKRGLSLRGKRYAKCDYVTTMSCKTYFLKFVFLILSSLLLTVQTNVLAMNIVQVVLKRYYLLKLIFKS